MQIGRSGKIALKDPSHRRPSTPNTRPQQRGPRQMAFGGTAKPFPTEVIRPISANCVDAGGATAGIDGRPLENSQQTTKGRLA